MCPLKSGRVSKFLIKYLMNLLDFINVYYTFHLYYKLTIFIKVLIYFNKVLIILLNNLLKYQYTLIE